jgi:hypothetical protein
LVNVLAGKLNMVVTSGSLSTVFRPPHSNPLPPKRGERGQVRSPGLMTAELGIDPIFFPLPQWGRGLG